LKNTKIKYQFSIKSEDELDKLNHEELLKYIKNLQKNIKQEEPPKNSNNSSIPPSTEIQSPKKNQSVRKRSDKKSGGQDGHKGITLKQSNNPDEIIDIEFNINSCKKCGYDISNTIAKLKEKRQVLDLKLEDIKTKIVQYQSYSKVCTNCGYNNHDNSYPALVAPYISYGKNITAIVSYLSVVHYLSYNRIVLALKNLYKISISEGTVDRIIKRASKLSQKEINTITSQLELSDLVGIDETGCKVNGSRYWHWTFQNDKSTFIVANKSRGAKVITDNFTNGFVNATVVHDNYSGYSNLECKDEQLCLAHKLRDLNYAIECEDTKLMKDIKSLLLESMKDHKLDLTLNQRVVLKKQYDQILEVLLTGLSYGNKQTTLQIKSFKKAKNKIFTFLLNPNIPPDNNGSERAIRNIKVKLKVSQQFKSLQGAEDYANLRSIVDTARKRGIDEFESLTTIIGGNSLF
jgi:hypothetical protein